MKRSVEKDLILIGRQFQRLGEELERRDRVRQRSEFYQ